MILHHDLETGKQYLINNPYAAIGGLYAPAAQIRLVNLGMPGIAMKHNRITLQCGALDRGYKLAGIELAGRYVIGQHASQRVHVREQNTQKLFWQSAESDVICNIFFGQVVVLAIKPQAITG